MPKACIALSNSDTCNSFVRYSHQNGLGEITCFVLIYIIHLELKLIMNKLYIVAIGYSKSPRIRIYFFESQAEVASYFKGTKTKFKV